MKTKLKTEFICVQPRTDHARKLFEDSMYKLHSCRVIKRESGKVFLQSINNLYTFSIFEGGDDNWEVIK